MKAADICSTAGNLVGGDRAKMHGAMLDNFTRIAGLWNAYLSDKLTAPLTATDVGLLMALVKIARTKTGSHNLDNYIDLAGYAGCAGEVADALNGAERMDRR